MSEAGEAGQELELLLLDMPAKERYEVLIAEDGAMVALVTYRLSANWIALLHTEVQAGFEGQGMGSRTAELVFDDARARGLKVVPKCPFILRWLERHPEQHDILLQSLTPAPPDTTSTPPLEMS
jgi:uncharacterized protein